jgi:hypothetical protein
MVSAYSTHVTDTSDLASVHKNPRKYMYILYIHEAFAATVNE